MASAKWGYGWGVGKQRPMEDDLIEESEPSSRSSSQRTPHSLSRNNSGRSGRSAPLPVPPQRKDSQSSKHGKESQSSKDSRDLYRNDSHRSKRSTSSRHARFLANDSSSTLVGSAFERKLNEVDVIEEKIDSTERLADLRKQMEKDNLDYYVIPSEDAHQSEYVASSDKRRRFISGFTGSAGEAIVSRSAAYLITDSRYWLQAQEQCDHNWHIIPAGTNDGPRDWIEWLVDRVKDCRIGIDARMISHEKASTLTTKVNAKSSKLIFPPQNLVDLVWKDKPPKSKEPIFIHSIDFAGRSAGSKLAELKEWLKAQPAATLSFSKAPPTASQIHVGTLVTSLTCIAWLLNLRGSDIPYNPIFQAYLFVGFDKSILFVDQSKVGDDVADYLDGLGVERRDYNDLWTFLRKREWGEGKVIISPQTSYAISLMLTHFRFTIAPSHIEELMAIKNTTEIDGLRRAYTRDGASFVRFLAWLESKMGEGGYEITEYEAASRLTEYRRHNKHFMGLAYENISASGPNAALPHYTPVKSKAKFIDRDTPYLNDSGGQYRDGTCDTTRTIHLGRPTSEQCDAYTRVLQGHIAIDSAVFPEGTSGHQLDVLARKALWKDGMNYMHGTGHGFGSFLTVHEGSHGFSSTTPLKQGHVVTNEPGYYNEGKWGIRIESALVVRKAKHLKSDPNSGNVTWVNFERLTCVPIQTKMVKESMLTKEEAKWIKDHNRRCLEKLEPYLKDDKRALKWLRREAERGIGIPAAGPGGITVDWD